MRFMRTIFVSLALLLLPALCMAVSAGEHEARMKSYVAVLENFLRDGTLPDGGTAEDSEEDVFAVVDVTGDGAPELIIRYTTARLAELVATYDPQVDAVVTIFQGFPDVIYYSGGVLREDLPHNQGLGGDGDCWPHIIYRYDPTAKKYEICGFVEAWNKADFPTNPYDGGKPFPDDIDEDGDGMIYSVTLWGDPLVAPDSEYVDGPAYRAWEDGLVGGAESIDTPWLPADEDGLEQLKQGNSTEG